ncbi:MAG TPA: DNA helicase II, partial [Pseudomonadales bacterium]|nr:DNA helicase II [Pseudomonadales bacterium]
TRPVTAPGGFAAGVARRGEPVPGGLRLGQSVRHPTFGEGVVIDFEGQGSSARVSVNFRSAGAKWLVLSYARLEPLG